MATLSDNIAALSGQNGALPKPIQLAAAEVLTAAEKAGMHVPAVSWFNPASTPEHHVPGFKGSGGVAVDFMTYGSIGLQDWLDTYLWRNRDRLGICWIISRRRIRSTSPGKRGNWTAYSGPSPHTDHTHANFGHLAGTNGSRAVTKVAYVPLATGQPQPQQPVVSLATLQTVAKADADLKLVTAALADAGFTGTLREAYAAYQKSLGYSGADADGIPGQASLNKLGASHGFSVAQ